MRFSEYTLVEFLLLGWCRSGLFHSAIVPVGGLWSIAVLLAQWLPDFFDHWSAFLQLALRISLCYHALKAFPSSITCSVAGETDLVSVTFFMFLLQDIVLCHCTERWYSLLLCGALFVVLPISSFSTSPCSKVLLFKTSVNETDVENWEMVISFCCCQTTSFLQAVLGLESASTLRQMAPYHSAFEIYLFNYRSENAFWFFLRMEL